MIQKHVQDGMVKTTKVPGKENLADLGSKHLDAKCLNLFVKKCGFRFVEGKSRIAWKTENFHLSDADAETEEE